MLLLAADREDELTKQYDTIRPWSRLTHALYCFLLSELLIDSGDTTILFLLLLLRHETTPL